jgi:hypothetical protein
MSMKRSVKVERLELRLRGVSPREAREAARGVARELLEELARTGTAARGGHAHIERVDAAVRASEAGATGPGLRGAVAREVADAVRTRMK